MASNLVKILGSDYKLTFIKSPSYDKFTHFQLQRRPHLGGELTCLHRLEID